MRAGWFLVAYDVRDPRRLQRVHRLLRQRAVPVQESVFFFKGSEGALRRLLDEAAQRMNLREDDLRAWPVDRMSEAWMYGAGVRTTALVPGRQGAWWRRLWRRWAA